MNRAEAEQIVTEFIKPVYGFMLKQTSSIQDAEDLTQEICLKSFRTLLLREDIENPDKFIWTMAHNTLSNYYRGKKSKSLSLCVDCFSELLSADEDITENLIRSETESRLHQEIAYLSKLQRKIVIAYYFENKKQQEIAQELGIPIGTVKWHLFEAKKDLKKGMETVRIAGELKFNPIRFSLMGLSGSVGSMGSTSNFFRSILSQNIAYSVYRQPKTINEIADCLGVSPVYVESEADFLEEYGFLRKKDNKYLVNFLIDEPNEKITDLHEKMYSKAAQIFANKLYDNLLNSGILKSTGLVCNQSCKTEDNINFMLWSLIPYIAALSGESLIENRIAFDEVATIRPDGAVNIAYASIEQKNGPKPKYYESIRNWCGPCWNSNGDLLLWQIDSEWSKKRVGDNYQNSVQRDLALLGRFLKGEPLSRDEYAYLIEKGYLKNVCQTGESFTPSLQIVWIKDIKTKQELLSIGDHIKGKHHEVFCKLKAPYVKAVMDNTPNHLKKVQAYGLQHIFHSDGWFLLHCLKELVGNGKLKPPSDEQRKSLTTIIVPND